VNLVVWKVKARAVRSNHIYPPSQGETIPRPRNIDQRILILEVYQYRHPRVKSLMEQEHETHWTGG
jgi:hypothetical protein